MRRLLAPLWHPPEPGFAGGFYRARRILESLQRWEAAAVASDSFQVNMNNVRRYPSRALFSAVPGLFQLIRAINWIWSTIAIVALGLAWKGRFDIVYGGPSEILPISLGSLVVGKLRGIPVVLCNQNVRDTELWGMNRLVHRSADAIITVSEALASELRAEGIAETMYIGTNGVDDLSVPRVAVAYDAVFVGRHTEAKGIYDVLRVWRIVCDANPRAHLACIGAATPAMESSVARMVASLALERNVSLLGPVSESKKWQIYAASRLCVFPSHVEGWGIVPIEAHLAGLPVVAYDLPAYTSTIAKSPGATLLPVGDITAFANAVIRALSAEPPNEFALKKWAAQFTWAAATAREERIFDEIIMKAEARRE